MLTFSRSKNAYRRVLALPPTAVAFPTSPVYAHKGLSLPRLLVASVLDVAPKNAKVSTPRELDVPLTNREQSFGNLG